MDRRTFLVGASGAAAGVVSANHGHAAIITTAEITAGNAVNLTLTSGNSHTHSLALTSGQVASIGAGSQVSTPTGTGGGHTHTVTFN